MGDVLGDFVFQEISQFADVFRPRRFRPALALELPVRRVYLGDGSTPNGIRKEKESNNGEEFGGHQNLSDCPAMDRSKAAPVTRASRTRLFEILTDRLMEER